MIHPVGHCATRIFGLLPVDRLKRQAGTTELVVVAKASALFDDSAVRWLLDNPATILATCSRPLAVAVDPRQIGGAVAAVEGGSGSFPIVEVEALGAQYVRKLRRRSDMLAFSLDDIPVAKAERRLFDQVYKGVTDAVTKYIWPTPAFWATRLAARSGIPPNAITVVGIALTIIAGWLFWIGAIAAALVAAWTMTFLDTVDGKLARVTVTSSRIGNWLDHGTDIIHPPLWWICLAHGLTVNDPASSEALWTACWLILGAYVVGRAVEVGFHRLFGFNGFLFRRFDSLFRLVVARRNILLLVMSIGLLIGAPGPAFYACAGWSVVSALLQAVRIAQAKRASRHQELSPWIA